MAQKILSLIKDVKNAARMISYYLLPYSYEDLKQFAAGAKKGNFQVEITKKHISYLNLENNTPNSQIGMECFRLRGRGYGKKRDIICDIPIGCYGPLTDISQHLKREEENMEKITEVLDFFNVPFEIKKGLWEKFLDATPTSI